MEERLAELDDTEAQLPELREEIESWLRTQAELESGELGRRIASSPEELRQYQALQSKGQLDPVLAEKLQARLDLLRKPLLEAQASGLPVVSTRHTGIKDVVVEGETGFLVDECDVASMAKFMLETVRNPDLASGFGNAGATRIRKVFGVDQTINRLAKIISEVSPQTLNC